MRTKQLFLCMLFLLIGTSAAWADKYYKVVYNLGDRQRVATPVPGKKYMIFNTTFNGSTDFTGFLYNNGTGLSVDKSRDNDRFIYNECFIFELVTVDESNKKYAIRSLSSGTYVNVEGSTSSSTPQTLLMYTWDEAVAGDGFDPSKTGAATITENNGIKQAFVNSENRDNSVIYYNNITSASNRVFIFSSEDKTRYWSGNEDSFFGWETGQPFAFYEVEELTSDYNYEQINSGVYEYLNISDLHIYSRCDLYSAQQIYGYVTDASQIKPVLSDGTEMSFGDGTSAAALLDGNNTSYAVTDWEIKTTGHAFEIDLGEDVSSFRLCLQRRADGKDILREFELQVSTDGTSYASVGTFTTDLESNVSDNILFTATELQGKTFSKIRIVATNTTAMPTYQCMGLAELYVLPDIPVINDAMAYLDSTLPVRASIKEYNALLENLNKTVPAVKLLSGVPLPGNKYRIYADAYYDGRYINREVYTDGTNLYADGDYANASEDYKAQYEWYCEASTTEGKLLFRNAKYPTMYLSNSSVSTTATEWEINTSKTQRHGVPLRLNSMQYLAVFNDGTAFQGNVKEVQNQTAGSVTIDVNNTPDDATDDTTVTCGLCTDFVFLPVELDDDEKQISIVTFSPLVERNTTVTYGGNTYSLPYSVIVKGDNPVLPVVTNNVPTYHPVDGYYRKNVKVGDDLATAVAAVNNGDVLELRYTIARPFYKYGEEGNYTLYRIKNLRAQGLAQQAGPNRSNINVEEGEGQISTQSGKFYCAQFTTRDTNLALVEYKETEYSAETFFYFEASDATEGDLEYSVFINSAITSFKCEAANKWTKTGIVYYVQPNYNSGDLEGYTISRTALSADNNPGNAWCSNHSSGDIVIDYYAEDAGSAWYFEPVDEATAQSTLKDYIATLATTITGKLDGMTGYETDKVNSYKSLVSGKATDASNATDVATLVGISQELHMIEHELDYGLQALPQESNEELFSTDKSALHWYYVKNVYGSSLVENTNQYAAYNNGDKLMTFSEGTAGDYSDLTLYNLYHFAGETVNKDQYNEYLDVHVHNFMALNDSVLVGRNDVLYENLTFTGVDKSGATTASAIAGTNVALSKNSTWEITAEFTSNGNTTNHYGTCLLTTQQNSTATTFSNGFQVYLQSTGSVVVKAGTASDDYYKFTHTDEANSKLKIVLSYAEGRLSVAVTNSLGETKTIKDITGGDNYIPCTTIKDITQLYTNAPDGVNITSLKAENVLAMQWNAHNAEEKWYILPSSNTEYKGLAVVMQSADDTNMGWSNVSGKNQEVFTDLGYANYSTWQFVKVTEFDNHLQELLALYGIEDCVIYNKELAQLYTTIIENKAIIETEAGTEAEEAAFNTIYDLLRYYDGPNPEELKAPKPGTLYTIRPAVEESTQNALLVHTDAATATYSTKEVYNASVFRSDNSYDSRAAWVFEGTAESDGFLPLTGLKVKNLHTQCNIATLGDDASLVADDTETTVTLAPLGACTTQFKVGEGYMNRTAVSNTINYLGSNSATFWGSAVTASTAVQTVINDNSLGAGTVHCKSTGVEVTEEGDVTVTFTYTDGSHKINILGVELVAIDGKVKYSSYAYRTAGGDPKTATYTLSTVFPGVYTLNCYVYDPSGSGEDDLTETIGNFVITGVTEVSGVAKVTNTGTATTKWIIEEIENPQESVYHLTNTAQHGHGTLKLGFPALIPEGVEAFHAKVHGDIRDDRYISMVSYGEPTDETRILPSNTAVMLRNVDGEAATKEFKFYYSENDATPVADNYIHGVLYNTIIDCSSYDTTDFDGDGVADGDVNIYMLQASKNTAKLYWIYEERSADGTIKDGNANTDNGGYIICKANRAFMVLPKIQVAETTSFSLRFGGGETTDIEDVIEEGSDVEIIESIYDLQGRRLDEITEPGIYIINGKKVFIK